MTPTNYRNEPTYRRKAAIPSILHYFIFVWKCMMISQNYTPISFHTIRNIFEIHIMFDFFFLLFSLRKCHQGSSRRRHLLWIATNVHRAVRQQFFRLWRVGKLTRLEPTLDKPTLSNTIYITWNWYLISYMCHQSAIIQKGGNFLIHKNMAYHKGKKFNISRYILP